MDKINLGVDKGFVEMERKDIAREAKKSKLAGG